MPLQIEQDDVRMANKFIKNIQPYVYGTITGYKFPNGINLTVVYAEKLSETDLDESWHLTWKRWYEKDHQFGETQELTFRYVWNKDSKVLQLMRSP